VLIGELYLDRLYKLPLRRPVAREISRYQPVRRDFSLVLDESIAWETIDHAIAELRIPELVEWRVREVFRDARLGKGEYSLLRGRDVPGTGSDAARGRIAGVPGARGGSRWQGGSAAAGLSARQRI
jgi:hypothetical protein